MNKATLLIMLAFSIVALLISNYTYAAPGGASIVSNNTSGVPSTAPGSLTQDRGTITTIVLSSTQQDQNWKAYVGNITGQLSLDDANGNTIYDWALSSVNKSGEVYVSRSNSILWPNVSCVNTGNVTAEETFHNMTSAQVDNINKTFNYTSHAQFFVGTVNIAQNSCKSTATYISNNTQTMDGTQKFQEVVLQDTDSNLVFVALVNNSYAGFDTRSYDFQIIVPESAVKTNPTTYYFYTELSG